MANNDAPRLINATGEVFELTSPVTGLGRASDNQIVLVSSKTSRYHAQIVERGGLYILRDLGSKNGSKINGQLVQGERELHNRDQILVGDLQFTFDTTASLETETATNAAVLPMQNQALQVDLTAMEVKLDGRVLNPPLSLLEWKLLVLLYQNSGKVCDRNLIIETLYHPTDPESIPFDTAIETLVSRLRKRLQMHNPTRLPYIKTVRGVGYKLEL